MSPSVPTRRSRAAAVASAVVAVALVGSAPSQMLALGVVSVGVGIALAGTWAATERSLRWLAAALGVAVVAAGVGLLVVRAPGLGPTVEAFLGLLGVAAIGAALAPARGGWERYLLATGTALLVLMLVVSGATRSASTVRLLTAGAATVLAWDLGEQAVSLGEQVGATGVRARGEFVHGGATMAVGVGGVAGALVLRSAGPSGLPLPALVLLLAAGVVLLLSSFN